MKFCNYCDNMLYPKVDDTFKNYCKNCNTEFEREDKCVYKQNYDKKTYSSLSYINTKKQFENYIKKHTYTQ